MRLAHWPARWKQRGRTIYYRPRPEEREKFGGKHWYPLGKTEQEAFAVWFRLQDGVVVPRTIRDAVAIYQGSERYLRLAAKTRRDYDRALAAIRDVFGHMRPQDLLPSDVYQWMAKLPAVTGNRYRAVLLNVMAVCVEHGALDRNPIREVRQRREEARDRYVTDDEVDAFLKHCTPLLKAYVGLKLLTGLRQGQLLELRVSDWDGERLKVAGRKRGRSAIYSGDGLKEAVEAALAVRKGKFPATTLFCTRRGQQYTGDGFRALWQYAMAKYVEAGGERFTEHDLRAKVASDSDTLDVAQARLQHQSRSTTNRVYRRAPAKVEVLKR